MKRKRAQPSRLGLAMVVDPHREEAAQWRRYRNGGDAALKEQLFNRYRRLARAVAWHQIRRTGIKGDLQQDVEQLAYGGLIEAIDRYEPARGTPFVAYAKARITGSIINGLGSINERGAHARFFARQERLNALTRSGGSTGSAIGELADLVAEIALGLMLEREEQNSSGRFAGEADSGFDNLAWRETRMLLAERVTALPDTEHAIIRLHYQNDLSFAQIAAMLQLSAGRISQLHKAALTKLRKSMRAMP